jgi:hypothetical protein
LAAGCGRNRGWGAWVRGHRGSGPAAAPESPLRKVVARPSFHIGHYDGPPPPTRRRPQRPGGEHVTPPSHSARGPSHPRRGPARPPRTGSGAQDRLARSGPARAPRTGSRAQDRLGRPGPARALGTGSRALRYRRRTSVTRP